MGCAKALSRNVKQCIQDLTFGKQQCWDRSTGLTFQWAQGQHEAHALLDLIANPFIPTQPGSPSSYRSHINYCLDAGIKLRSMSMLNSCYTTEQQLMLQRITSRIPLYSVDCFGLVWKVNSVAFIPHLSLRHLLCHLQASNTDAVLSFLIYSLSASFQVRLPQISCGHNGAPLCFMMLSILPTIILGLHPHHSHGGVSLRGSQLSLCMWHLSLENSLVWWETSLLCDVSFSETQISSRGIINHDK